MTRPKRSALWLAVATAAVSAAAPSCSENRAATAPPADPAAKRAPEPLVASAERTDRDGEKGAPVHRYRVVQSYPHDPRAFTQGLLYQDGRLWESTGGYGTSTIREVELETGRVLRRRSLEPRYFGEGLVWRDGQLVQLTWQHQTALVWDANELRVLFTQRYDGEGWGLAYDGRRFILSDGTARLRFLHPDSFAPLGSVTVTDAGRPVQRLNELEWVDGELYANVWHTDRIARIDVATGRVNSWIDLSGLIDLPPDPPIGERQNVLNGIAWDAQGKRLFVTGKNWPRLFHVEVLPRAGD